MQPNNNGMIKYSELSGLVDSHNDVTHCVN